MKTLREITEATPCRKGPASIDSNGSRYWEASGVAICRSGGDGVGRSSARVVAYLSLRRDRQGRASAVVQEEGWHQNTGTRAATEDVAAILEMPTAEDVAAWLVARGHSRRAWADRIIKDLVALGMTAREPSPDDVPTV